jgi:hypothetical protein
VYLFLTTVIAVLFLSGKILLFITEDYSIINITISGVYHYKTEVGERLGSSLLLSVPVSLTGMIAVISVFLFKNRKLQIRLSIAGLVFAFSGFLAEVYYLYDINTRYTIDSGPGIKLFLPLIMMLLLFLAYRAIRKDDRLVRSYDRLR